MKSILIKLFLLIYCIVGASSCKVNSVSKNTKDTTKNSDSIDDLPYNDTQTKLNPNEAIVVFKIARVSSPQNYIASVKQLKSQGFGFSANLIAGDTIQIKTSKLQLEIGSPYTCILEQTETKSSPAPTFTLIRVIKK